MAVIETTTFRPAAGAAEEALLAADRRVQTEFAYQQPGILRRTTARGDDGEWLVVTVWATRHDAERAVEAAGHHPAIGALLDVVDVSSVATRLYDTLG